MRIAITGSTGLIGTALVRSLRTDGHDVVRLVRRAPAAAGEVRWDPKRQELDPAGLAGCEAVVHLAGAGVGDHRWTAAYKQEIRDSRVLGTRTLAAALTAMDTPPRVFVSGSAIGYYGDTGDRRTDESAPAGHGFLPEVCTAWEDAAKPARDAGIRTVFARTGLVVARSGGAWGGSSRSSGSASAAGSGTAASTGASSRWRTTSRRCATSWTPTTSPDRSTSRRRNRSRTAR